MAFVYKTGDWPKAKAMMNRMIRDTKIAIDRTVHDEAALYVKWVQRAYATGGTSIGNPWTKLASLTIALRKGSGKLRDASGRFTRSVKPLLKTGDMRRSVRVEQVGWATYFGGIHRTSPTANIAAVHESGTGRDGIQTIPVTDKMRRYFMYLYVSGVIQHPLPFKNKTEIVIVQRSAINHTYRRFAPGFERRVSKRIAAQLINGVRLPVETF